MSVLIEDGDSVCRNITLLNRMRLLGQCCDAVLGTDDGGMFRVHKTIMSCCSSYFRILFRTSLGGRHWGDGDASRTFIVVPNVSAGILENIIDFAYCGETLITGDNVDYLFSAADQFSIHGIVERCTEFILNNITPENCLGVWRFGKYYTLFPFESRAFEYIMENFPRIFEASSEFLYLSFDELKLILKEDALNAQSELLVWHAIKRWVDLKPSARAHRVLELFQCIRLPVISISDLPSMVNEFFLLEDPQYAPYMKRVGRYVLQRMKDYNENCLCLEDPSEFMPRHPRHLLFCCDGLRQHEDAATFEVYDSRADVWKQVEIENNRMLQRKCHQCVSLGQFIYFIGGNEGPFFSNSCYRFDTLRKVFEEMAPMHELRSFYCSAEHDAKIYVFGGFDGFHRLHSVERYTPHINQWDYIEPMHIKRSDASSCTVRNRIFVVGGYDGLHYIQSAEVYDIEEKQWHQLPKMLTPRSSMGCVALNDCLYVVGGNEHGSNLNTVEKFSLLHEQWFVGKPMKLSRSNFGIQVMDKKNIRCRGLF